MYNTNNAHQRGAQPNNGNNESVHILTRIITVALITMKPEMSTIKQIFFASISLCIVCNRMLVKFFDAKATVKRVYIEHELKNFSISKCLKNYI